MKSSRTNDDIIVRKMKPTRPLYEPAKGKCLPQKAQGKSQPVKKLIFKNKNLIEGKKGTPNDAMGGRRRSY